MRGEILSVRFVLAGSIALPPIKFLAGWNMPGCLPETPYEEFDTFEEAKVYILSELDDVLDNLLTGDCPIEADACEKAIQWVRRQSEPFGIGPINQYHYEVTRAE